MKNLITKETVLADLLKDEKMEAILARHNVPCLSCPMAQYEMTSLKLGQICKMYNINLEELLKELNKN